MSLVEAHGLSRSFATRRTLLGGVAEQVRAVDRVDLHIDRGETLGIVGESGSGKSTLGRLLLRLLEAHAGSIIFDGQDITRLEGEALRRLRREMSLVFQDPYSSLDPSWSIGRIMAEPLKVHGLAPGTERAERVARMLEQVGLDAEYAQHYPHELSGGQRQRVVIARALITHPKFVVCDEPVSALDLSTRAQVLALLHQLQAELGLTYLLIAHDVAVVRVMCNRLAVMYLGQIVECGPTDAVVSEPAHPYTAALLSAIPVTNPLNRDHRRRIIGGDPLSPLAPPRGCHFHPRCPLAMPVCRERAPRSRPLPGGRSVACHLHDDETDGLRGESVLQRLNPPANPRPTRAGPA